MRVDPSDRSGATRTRRKRTKSKHPQSARGLTRGLKRLARVLGLTTSIVFLLSWGLVLPLRWIDPPTSAFMLQDSSGREPLAFQWASWSNISSSAPLAVVASEDQKFADHFGFDVESIKDSIDDYGGGGSLRGASTITQQLAKNLYLWSGRSFIRKGIEAYFTLLIELSLPKRRILEIYLNIVELGPGVYGVGAASELNFGKPPASLTDTEAALFAAVLPNPKRLQISRPSDYLRERQRWIVTQIQRLRRERWMASFDTHSGS